MYFMTFVSLLFSSSSMFVGKTIGLVALAETVDAVRHVGDSENLSSYEMSSSAEAKVVPIGYSEKNGDESGPSELVFPQQRRTQSNSYDYDGLFYVLYGYNQQFCSGAFPTLEISCPQEIRLDSDSRTSCRTTSDRDVACDIQVGIPTAEVRFRCLADSRLDLDPVAYIRGNTYPCNYNGGVEHYLYLAQACEFTTLVYYEYSSCNEGRRFTDTAGRPYCGDTSDFCYNSAGCWLSVLDVETEINPFKLERSCLLSNTSSPTRNPTPRPSPRPSPSPTQRTDSPTDSPTSSPSIVPPTSSPTTPLPTTPFPTTAPTPQPMDAPTPQPTGGPMPLPSVAPIALPSPQPTDEPTTQPSHAPSPEPSAFPTAAPTCKTWDCHCSSTTNNDLPCLSRVQDALGYGFDAVTGLNTRRVIDLDIENTKIFSHSILGLLEIPGNVECQDLSGTRREKSTTLFFQSSEEYRRHIAIRKGVFGRMQAVYFAVNTEFQNAYAKSFQVGRVVVESLFDQPLYRCRINDALLSSTVESIVRNNQGDDAVARLGTHVVEVVEFGGSVLLTGSAEACVLHSGSKYNITSKLNAAFWRLAGGTNQIWVQLQEGCDVQVQLSIWEKQIDGGDLSSLPSSESSSDSLDSWYESISNNPAPVKFQMAEISSIIDGIVDADVLEYTQRFNDPEELSVDASPCLSGCAKLASGSSETNGDYLFALVMSAFGRWLFW